MDINVHRGSEEAYNYTAYHGEASGGILQDKKNKCSFPRGNFYMMAAAERRLLMLVKQDGYDPNHHMTACIKWMGRPFYSTRLFHFDALISPD